MLIYSCFYKKNFIAPVSLLFRHTVYLFIYEFLHVSTFMCHYQGVLHLYLANLYEFLKLKLLKLQIYKIIKIY